MEEELKIQEPIIRTTAEFMTAILRDKKRKTPVFKEKLQDKDILKIKDTMIEVLKQKAKNTGSINIHAHYCGRN